MNLLKKYNLKNSLQLRLTALFISLAIGPLIIVGLILAERSFSALSIRAIELEHQVAERIADNITVFIETRENELRLLTGIRGIQDLEENEQKRILGGLMQDIYNEIILLDKNGNETLYHSRTSVVSSRESKNWQGKNEFKKPKLMHSTYYSSVQFNEETNNPFMIIAIPLIDLRSGEFDGILIANFRFKTVWDLMVDAHINNKSAFLIDAENKVIAHHNPSIVLKETYFEPPETDGFYPGLDNANAALAIEQIKLGEQTFSVIAEEPATEALALANNVITITIIAMSIALVMAIAIGLFAAHQIIQPIQKLVTTSEAISTGDLSQRVNINSQDEIGKLATSFNNMTNKLQQTLGNMEEQRELLEVTLSSIGDAVIATDTAGLITFMNPTAEMLTGWQKEKTEGLSINKVFNIINEQTGKKTKSPVDNVLEKGVIVGLANHTILITKQGKQIPIDDSGAPIKDKKGKLMGVVLVFHDVTQRREQQRELLSAKEAAETANQAKSEFLANMSHELRTPLNSILGYTQILQLDKDLSQSQLKAITIMHQSGEHLLTLLNDILDLSKIEAGRMETHPVEFDLSAFLLDIVTIFQIRAEQKSIWFMYETVSDLPKGVKGDDKRLRQILINLLSNAIKFTKEGGVTFKVGYHHDKIRFQIEDTGIGIESKYVETIFLPFEQVGHWRTKTEGTGLGLTISQRLSELMGGSLSVQSIAGKGSIFWLDIELPAIEGWQRTVKSDKPTVIGIKNLDNRDAYKILIVDDIKANREVLRSRLAPLGFEVFEAADGQEGLEEAINLKPDLILMDIRMPVMDGLEATRQIRNLADLKEVIIIAITASAFDEDKGISLDVGCNDFIPKPVKLTSLLDKIEHHLELEWLYKEEEKKSPHLKTQQGLIGPPPERAKALFELATLGAFKQIKNEIASLEALDKQYQPFVDTIRELIGQYNFEKICKVVEPYIEDN